MEITFVGFVLLSASFTWPNDRLFFSFYTRCRFFSTVTLLVSIFSNTLDALKKKIHIKKSFWRILCARVESDQRAWRLARRGLGQLRSRHPMDAFASSNKLYFKWSRLNLSILSIVIFVMQKAGYVLSTIEWLTFSFTQKYGAKWKDTFATSPFPIRTIFKNNFRNPLGLTAVTAGMFFSFRNNLWMIFRLKRYSCKKLTLKILIRTKRYQSLNSLAEIYQLKIFNKQVYFNLPLIKISNR